MNKQFEIINGKRVSTKIEWTHYTYNPIGGCFHACQWDMPNGKVANCYAEDVAEKIASSAYPQGFEHHYWRPKQLNAPLGVKEPSRIFLGSMADVFGHWVPADQIEQVLDVCRKAYWHSFQLLTKNLPRVKQFDIPENCWIGASSPPDYMWNKPLSTQQKEKMLHQILGNLSECPDHITWMSMEPYSWDMLPIIQQYPNALKWVVVGAASNGKQYYAPNYDDTWALVDYLEERKIPIFFKGNMKSLRDTDRRWHDAFPTLPFKNR